MRYLITGHTGFKGSWLALMLEMQGHTVSGIALDPPVKSLFNQADLSPIFKHDLRIDIRDRVLIKQAVERIDPEVIIHLAAQPLVRESYVSGTLNVLEATRELRNLKAALIITTDKVYKNHNYLHGYVETDELGGDDPYSASKAAADIAAQSWIRNFAKVPMSIARAGNVIGGGDWATDRIIPDLVNAYSEGVLPRLRYPHAIRPWQHVLDCLNGYIKLINFMVDTKISGTWNFGPDLNEIRTVGELAATFAQYYKLSGKYWNLENSAPQYESPYLVLDSTKSTQALDWVNKLNFDEAVNWTAQWYLQTTENSANIMSKKQIKCFFDL